MPTLPFLIGLNSSNLWVRELYNFIVRFSFRHFIFSERVKKCKLVFSLTGLVVFERVMKPKLHPRALAGEESEKITKPVELL